MSEEDKTTEEKLIEELTSLDINPKNVYHITLLSGQEFIGELVPEKKRTKYKDLIFLYPIKIIDEYYGDSSSEKVMYKWNDATDQEYIPINPNSVTSIVPLNNDYLLQYVYGVKIHYFFELFLEEQQILEAIEKLKDVKKPSKPSKPSTNIIEFSKYFKKSKTLNQ